MAEFSCLSNLFASSWRHTTARTRVWIGAIVGVPSSCALDGFATGTRISLLWQYSAEREMSASACILALCVVEIVLLNLIDLDHRLMGLPVAQWVAGTDLWPMTHWPTVCSAVWTALLSHYSLPISQSSRKSTDNFFELSCLQTEKRRSKQYTCRYSSGGGKYQRTLVADVRCSLW